MGAIRIKNALNRSETAGEKKMLERLIDTESQKIVLKPGHEYFSSSHADVLSNRLLRKTKVLTY